MFNPNPTLDYYTSITNPMVVSGITAVEWFEMIINSPYKDKIIEARNSPHKKDEIKKDLPCVTYSFNFKGYKKNENITDTTGCIYFDIDDPSFQISDQQMSKCLATYRSVGGLGRAIIYLVDGLTPENFKHNYFKVAFELGLDQYIDSNAAKMSQFNVLSYDEALYLNPRPKIFQATNPEGVPQSPLLNRKKKNIAYRGEWGTLTRRTVRFNNLDDYQTDGDYVVNWEGMDYICCWLPYQKKHINRNATLLSYTGNLVYLNPWIPEQRLYDIISSVNERAFINPVSSEQLRRVIKSVRTYQQQGTLKPVYYKKPRKIIFNKHSGLSATDKMEIAISLNAEKKTQDSINKLYSILEAWDFDQYGLISVRNIAKHHPISKKTVAKYYKNFKQYIEDLNNSHIYKNKEQ